MPLWLMGVVTACIDGQRQQGGTATDTISDTVETVEPDTHGDITEPDTVPDTVDTVELDTDTTDTTDDTHDIRTCDTAPDCPTVACVTFECIAHQCQPTLLTDTPCSDNNVCTQDDTCQNGVCKPGVPLTCEPFDAQCWDGPTACDSVIGCGAPRDAGTRCDNATGNPPLMCTSGWQTPSDTCDGHGVCVDGPQPPKGIHPLTGDWFTILASAPPQGNAATVRTFITYKNANEFQLSRTATTENAGTSALADLFANTTGTFCTELGGRTELTIGDTHLRARTDKDHELMLLSDRTPDGMAQRHGIAIRANGTAAQVNGTYHIVSTALYGSTTTPNTQFTTPLMTWQGYLGFSNGCIDNGGQVSTGAGLGDAYRYDDDSNDCFTTHNGGHKLTTDAIAGLGAHTTVQQVHWMGAIGKNGDVIVLARERDADYLHYGITILVRDQPFVRANLSGQFEFLSITDGIQHANQPSYQPRLEVGTIDYHPQGNVGGQMASGPVGPGTWYTHAVNKRYAHVVTFGARSLTHTGWVAPGDHFLVAWRVDPPADFDTPMPFPFTPLEGSLFLALQATDYLSVPPSDLGPAP